MGIDASASLIAAVKRRSQSATKPATITDGRRNQPPEPIPINQTRVIQSRDAISEEIIVEYMEAKLQGNTFPPVEAYFDGAVYWIPDGVHRVEADRRNGKSVVLATVRPVGPWQSLPVEDEMAFIQACGSDVEHNSARENDVNE